MSERTATTRLSESERRLVETTGIEVVDEGQRTAKPSDLFWPWFAANVSVFGISYSSFVYGFGVSFVQALVVTVVGIVLSFLACGIIAIAGKRGSVPTMVLSRAAFGVNGQKVPGVFSWLISMGWETFLAIMAVLATATVFRQLGWSDGTTTKVLACAVIAALIVLASVAGYHTIMRLQSVLTWVTGAVTVAYVVMTLGRIDLGAVLSREGAPAEAVIGALVMLMTGFGLGWINIAADWSRYQRRDTPGAAIAFWNTFGGALAPTLLVIYGLLLIGSDPALEEGIVADPIGTLATILPIWFLVPFLLAAVLALVSGAVLGIYSSGLTLLSLGVRIPRPAAALIDGTILTLGTIWVVFFAQSFLAPFQSFLITLGVPIAAWAGILMADVALRRRDYDERALFDPAGRYGDWNWTAIAIMVVASVVGWGLVINLFADAAPWNNWQGYLLGPIGGKEGTWAWANTGVLVSLAIGFLGWLALGRSVVRRQEEGLPAAGSRRERVPSS